MDAKNKLLLDNYKEEEVRAHGTPNEESEAHEKKEDNDVVESIQRILSEYRSDIDNFEAIQEEQQLAKSSKMLQSASIEEDKRDLINREIGKFRKTAEADEQKKEKEKDRRKREEKESRDRDKHRSSSSPRKEKDKKSSSSRRRSRSRDRNDRDRSKVKNRFFFTNFL